MIPPTDFLERYYTDKEVAFLEDLRTLTDRIADEEKRGAVGRKALRHFWDDELTYIQKTHWLHKQKKPGPPQLLRPNYAQIAFYQLILDARAQKIPIRIIVLKARQLGFCVDPNTRVLTADLRWVRIDDLEVGQHVVAVDEEIPDNKPNERKSRLMRTAVVQAKASRRRPVRRITMASGEVLIMTAEHRMLCRQRGGDYMRWRQAGDMQVGDEIRYITKPWRDAEVEDGWFGGILDGEGSFALHGSPSVCASQLRGPVWDRMEKYLRDRGYRYCVESDGAVRKTKYGKAPVPKLVVGRMNDIFRVLGQTRPTRFVNKRWWEGRALPGKKSGEATERIVSIEDLPTQRVVDIQTSTGTFIAEGYVSHNSSLIQSWQYEQCDREGNRCSLTLSYDEGSSIELFQKSRHVQENMWFPRKTGRNSGTVLEMIGHNSTIFVKTSGNLSAGRGDTYHHLHGSELPMWENAGETLVSAMQAVPEQPDTSVVLESTAKGAVGEFYDEWNKAVRGENNFVPFFAPWFWDPEYSIGFADDDAENAFGRSLDLTERRLMDGHKLTLAQLHWRRRTIKGKCQGSEAKFRQEYPSTAMEAFLTTGAPVFSAEGIANLERNAAPPQWRGNAHLEIA